MANDTGTNFEEVKTRLDEIVDAVADENISLDNALDLYEEAIKLGMQVSSLLEEDIAPEEVQARVGRMDAEDAEQAQAEGSIADGQEGAVDPAEVDQASDEEVVVESDIVSVPVEGELHE